MKNIAILVRTVIISNFKHRETKRKVILQIFYWKIFNIEFKVILQTCIENLRHIIKIYILYFEPPGFIYFYTTSPRDPEFVFLHP